MRTAISGISIYNKELLLVEKKGVFILPGGKPDKGESDIECLYRELDEELKVEPNDEPIYYKPFKGITPFKNDELLNKTYFIKIPYKTYDGCAEITRGIYIKDFENYNISDITKKEIEQLKLDGYL
jgi:8-oxo-dGTP pyrophosphatase MutT (NUDIX family)